MGGRGGNNGTASDASIARGLSTPDRQISASDIAGVRQRAVASRTTDRINRLNTSTYRGKTQFSANGKTVSIGHYTNQAGVRMYQVSTGIGENKTASTYYTLQGAKESAKKKLDLE